MLKIRVIPCLLLDEDGLVKTVKFSKPNYIGDPINAVKIFNEKEVDELVILDINASSRKREPNYQLISEVASECFMPLAYGGGITSVEQAEKIFELGVEKVILNTQAVLNPNLITELSKKFGNQSVVVSIDYKRDFWNKYYVYINRGRNKTKYSPVEFAKMIEGYGAGELICTSIKHEGEMRGYDVDMSVKICDSVRIPVVVNGGAGSIDDIANITLTSNISAAAAGSIFVYKDIHKAVLINYFSRNVMIEKLK